MFIYANLNRYSKTKDIIPALQQLDPQLFMKAQLQEYRISKCDMIFLAEVHIINKIIGISFQYDRKLFEECALKALKQNQVWEFLLNISKCRSLFALSIKANIPNFDHIDIILKKHINLINHAAIEPIKQVIKRETSQQIQNSVEEFDEKVIDSSKYLPYLFNWLIQRCRMEGLQRYRFIIGLLDKIFRMSTDLCFVNKFKHQVIQERDFDFIRYFRFQLTQIHDITVGLLQYFCEIVILLEKSTKNRCFEFEMVAEIDDLARLFFQHVLEFKQNSRYRYLQAFILKYSIAHTQIPFYLVLNKRLNTTQQQSLQQMLLVKDQNLFRCYFLKNMNKAAKEVLNYFLKQSDVNLKKYPSNIIVDPLHFLMVKSKFWNDQFHSRVLAQALHVMLENWLQVLAQKSEQETKLSQYTKQLSLVVIQFLLSLPCQTRMLDNYPLQRNVLSSLFILPSFSTLANSCQYFFNIPWSHIILQYIECLITQQQGFHFLIKICDNWKGRIRTEIADRIISTLSVEGGINQKFVKDRLGLKTIVQNYKQFNSIPYLIS